MKYLMQEMERREAEQELPVIRLKIDYELMNLYDALQEGKRIEIRQIKERLHSLHHQLKKAQDNEG